MSTVQRRAVDQSSDDGEEQPRTEDSRTRQEEDKGRSTAEWVSTAISLLIVLALAGLLSYQHLYGPTGDAVVEVELHLDAVRHQAPLYYVPIRVANRGGKAAEDLLVRVTLVSSDSRETTEVQFPVLAGGESADATVAFRQDPAGGTIQTSSVGYARP